MTNKELKCNCGKVYKHRSSLSRHKKTCKIQIDTKNQDLLNKLINKSNELLDKITEIPGINSTIQNNIIQTTNINNEITFKIYLDKKCSDAISIEHFVNNLRITLDDYKTNIENGYVKGLGNMIVKNLKKMEITKRPIHCTDLNTQQFYIKDKSWVQKDGEEVAEKLLPLVTSALLKNVNKIWNDEYGLNWAENEKATEEYSNTILILTQGNNRDNIKQQLQTINYVSKNIFLKVDNLLSK